MSRSKTIALADARAKRAGEDTRAVVKTLREVAKKAHDGGAHGALVVVCYPDGRIVTTQTYAPGGQAWAQAVAGAAMLTRVLTDGLEDA